MATIAQDIVNRYIDGNTQEIIGEITERCVPPTIPGLQDLDDDSYAAYEFSDGSSLYVQDCGIDGVDIQVR